MSSQVNLKDKKRQRLVYFIALAVAMIVVMLGFLLQGNYTVTGQMKNLEAANAHSWARYISTLYETGTDAQAIASRLSSLVEEMRQEDPRILEIQVLKGSKFLFHTDSAKTGQSINPEDEQDKQTYDDQTQIKFRLKKKNIDDKYLLRITPDFPQKGQQMMTLVEPVMKGKRKLHAVIKLKYRSDIKGSSGIGLIFLTGIVIFVLAGILFIYLNSYQWLISIPALLLFMILGVYLSGNHADTLTQTVFNRKGEHLQQVFAVINREDPGELNVYLDGLKKKNVSGFYLEYKALSLLSPGGADKPGDVLQTRFPVTDQRSLLITPDEEYIRLQRQQFDKRTRTVSIAFLIIGYLLMTFIMAGYAFRTLTAVKKHYYSYIYIFPAMVGMIVLVFFPFVYGMTMGFFKITHQSWEFVGLNNFVRILSDFHPFTPGNFYFTLLVTVMWTVVNVVLHVGIGLILALVLNRPNMPLKKMYRVLLILPWAIPNYITALIWKGMFHKQFGAINAFLQAIGIEAVSWFNHFWTAFFANVATNTWLGFPFMMVISLGALQSIPSYLYEAAEVDGASKWQQFRNITLPLLKPALFPAIVLGTIWTFNMFNIIYLVSNGAPNRSTDILITQAFRYAFEEFNWGFAAAYSIIIFLILLAYGTFSNRATKATEGVF